jgi:hypothetical protein
LVYLTNHSPFHASYNVGQENELADEWEEASNEEILSNFYIMQSKLPAKTKLNY